MRPEPGGPPPGPGGDGAGGSVPGAVLAGSATGSIYDLGYRRYSGPRLGRAHAFRVLYGRSLRWVFGIGRGGTAKIVPFGLAVMTLLPALVTVGIQALLGDRANQVRGLNAFQPTGFVPNVETMLVFFVIAQAPELLGRDQRHGTLTLYFSRAMGRLDYALAKFLALATALALVVLVPQTIMLVGLLFTSVDLGVGFGKAVPLVLPAIGSALAAGGLLSGIALAIAAFTPRRAYASGAIAAVLLVFSGMATLVAARGATRGPLGWVALVDPGALIEGFNAAVFGVKPGTILVRSGVPVLVFAAVLLVATAGCVAILGARYRRIAA
jgi:ABC-2 type transport system permease protein